ncbi:MAG: sugar-transfer associated ATP-grasp domain-containing protein [Alphaproteobacteria bacterium]
MAGKPLLDSRKAAPRLGLVAAVIGARKAGRPFAGQVGDILRLRRRPSRLTSKEYYLFRLYEPGRTEDDKRAFLGERGQREVFRRLVDAGWAAAAHDKLLYYAVMRGLGFEVPRVLAVCHPSRRFAGAESLANPAEIAAFLRRAAYPMFGKPVTGKYSVGTVALAGHDAAGDLVRTAAGDVAKVEDFVAELAAFGTDGYLFQERLVAHPFVREVCGDRIATVRVVVLLEPVGPRVMRALWKIPAGRHVADNFWRAGNLLAALDGDGRLTRVVEGVGPAQRVIEAHPDTGFRLLGARLPDWDALVRLVLEAAPAFPGILMQAWDVALTERGLLLLELNIGGDVNLPQHAFGEGIYHDRVRALAEARGA